MAGSVIKIISTQTACFESYVIFTAEGQKKYAKYAKFGVFWENVLKMP
jgi:hypothetical protein